MSASAQAESGAEQIPRHTRTPQQEASNLPSSCPSPTLQLLGTDSSHTLAPGFLEQPLIFKILPEGAWLAQLVELATFDLTVVNSSLTPSVEIT